MKLILILFWLFSCGKNTNDRPHYLTTLSPQIDSDGDGMSDKDEIELGRNHLIADIETNQTVPDNRFTLTDDLLNEYEIILAPKRLMRTELLGLIIGVYKKEVSDINKLKFDFNAHEGFWKIFHRGVNFYHYHFESNKSLRHPLPADFNENRMIHINNFSDYGILETVKQATYRLIISTPENEKIFYLHPSIGIKTFLETQFGAHFENNHLIKLMGHSSTNTTLKPSIADSHLDDYRWEFYTDSLQPSETPEAGKTYAFVFANVDEFKQSSIESGKKIWHEKQTNIFDQKVERTFFFPSFYERSLSNTEHWTIWDHPIVQVRCNFFEVSDLGFQLKVPSQAEIISWLNHKLFKNTQVLWSQSSNRGTTVRINTFLSKLEQGGILNSIVEDTDVLVGIIKDNCPNGSPLTTALPKYSGYKEFYLAD